MFLIVIKKTTKKNLINSSYSTRDDDSVFMPNSSFTGNTKLNADNISIQSQNSNISNRYTEVVYPVIKTKTFDTGNAPTRNIRQIFEELKSKNSSYPNQQQQQQQQQQQMRQQVEIVKKIEKIPSSIYIAVRRLEFFFPKINMLKCFNNNQKLK